MNEGFPRIWLAPMAGESASVALVAAVCEAGGLGWLGGAYMGPQRLAQAIDEDPRADRAAVRRQSVLPPALAARRRQRGRLRRAAGALACDARAAATRAAGHAGG